MRKNVLKYMCNLISETDTFPSSVKVRVLKAIINLILTKNVWFLSPRIRDSRNSIAFKLETALHVGAVITINLK